MGVLAGWGPETPDRRDVLQVCKRGHPVTWHYIAESWARRRFCAQCAAPTITACEACNAPIQGYRWDHGRQAHVTFSVPAACADCGALFPWTVVPEVSAFHAAFLEFAKLISDDYSFSLPRVLSSLSAVAPAGLFRELYARSRLLASYCYTVRSTFRAAAPATHEQVEPYVEGAVSAARGFESLLDEVVNLLGFSEARSEPLQREYQLLREHLERAATDLERSLKDLGRGLGFRRLPVLADIAVKKVDSSGEWVYAPGDGFKFYVDLSDVASRAAREVFIVDAWVDKELFDLFLSRVPKSVPIRILTSKPNATFKTSGAKFLPGHTAGVFAKCSTGLHDRTIFVDDECYVVGQSFKDAAVRKPTYVIRLTDAALAWRREADALWTSGVDFVL